MQHCFFAGDVESSKGGWVPPFGNMVSFGICEVGNPLNYFYAELKLVFPHWWSRRTEGIHLITREYLEVHGTDPKEAMERSAQWVLDTAGDRIPVYCAKPVRFDFGFMDYYYRLFDITNPFQKTLDGREHFRLIFGLSPCARVRGRRIKREFPTSIPHIHHALSDSFEYEEQVAAMLRRMNPFEGSD